MKEIKKAVLLKKSFVFLPATLHSQIGVSTYQHDGDTGSPLRIVVAELRTQTH